MQLVRYLYRRCSDSCFSQGWCRNLEKAKSRARIIFPMPLFVPSRLLQQRDHVDLLSVHTLQGRWLKGERSDQQMGKQTGGGEGETELMGSDRTKQQPFLGNGARLTIKLATCIDYLLALCSVKVAALSVHSPVRRPFQLQRVWRTRS